MMINFEVEIRVLIIPKLVGITGIQILTQARPNSQMLSGPRWCNVELLGFLYKCLISILAYNMVFHSILPQL